MKRAFSPQTIYRVVLSKADYRRETSVLRAILETASAVALFILSLSCMVLLLPGRARAEARPAAVFETNMGTFRVELFTDLAPKTAKNFMNLIQIARHASAALNGGKKNLVFNFNKKERADYSPILIYPHEASIKERIDSLSSAVENT